MLIDILVVVLPVFLIVASGYGAARTGYVEAKAVQALGGFVLKVAMPALIFQAVASAPISETLNRGYLLAYAAATLGVFGLVVALARLFGGPGPGAALAGLGGAGANSGFVGYPVAAAALGGPVAAPILAQNMIVENLALIPLAILLAEAAGRGAGGPGLALLRTLRGMGRNPLLIAAGLGFVAAGLGAAPPEPVARAVGLLAAAAAPVALFVTGGVTAGVPAERLSPAVGWIVLAKLALHPLAVLLALSLAPGVDETLLVGGVLFAAAPMMTIYPILGARFGRERTAAAALTVATAAAPLTISALLALLPTPL